MDDGQFKKELESLNKMVLKMGNLVEETIHNSLVALETGNISSARSLVNNDQVIDKLELKISEECLKLLALYQPVASDLRFITTTMSIVTDLERMGDLAADIAAEVVEVGEKPLFGPIQDLPKIVKIVEMMLHKSLEAFVRRNTKEAKEVTVMKEKTDNFRKLVYSEIQKLLAENSKYTSCGLSLILINHHLERIACHVINIAEDVVYMVDAEIIKHKTPSSAV